MDNYFTDNIYNKIDYTIFPIKQGEYENCSFTNCNFSGVNLSNIIFVDCKFDSCNLSLVTFNNTALRDITFTNCKMLGLHFENCDKFGLSINFQNCILNHSSFFRVKLKNTSIINSNLTEVDFTECELPGTIFTGSDFFGATFYKTNIEKCDFRQAVNYSINPNNNQIAKSKFSMPQITGLLHHLSITIEH